MAHDSIKDLIYDSFGIIDEDMIEQMSNVFDQDRPYPSTTDIGTRYLVAASQDSISQANQG